MKRCKVIPIGLKRCPSCLVGVLYRVHEREICSRCTYGMPYHQDGAA